MHCLTDLRFTLRTLAHRCFDPRSRIVQSLFGIPPPITTDNDLWGDPNSIDMAGVCLYAYGGGPAFADDAYMVCRIFGAGGPRGIPRLRGSEQRYLPPRIPSSLCVHACVYSVYRTSTRARLAESTNMIKDIIIIWRRARSPERSDMYAGCMCPLQSRRAISGAIKWMR